jgi:hypothetical protein
MKRKPGEEISYYDTNQKIRVKIDKRLEEIAHIHAHLGTDSTEKEKQQAYKRIGRLEKEIEELDPYFYPDSY